MATFAARPIKAPFGVTTTGYTALPTTGTIKTREFGSEGFHITEIEITDLPLVATTNASVGGGALIYTLPAGNIVIKSAAMNLGIAGTAALNVADTPDLGIGTTVASGSIAVLSGTAAMENIMTGQTVSACDGTAVVNSVNTILAVPTANNHTVYLNLADGWAGIDAGMKATGKVIIEWYLLD